MRRAAVILTAFLAAPASAQVVAIPGPVMGKTVNGQVLSGTVRVDVPGGGRHFTKIETVTQVPVGSEFDTRHGEIRLTLAAGRNSVATQSGDFSRGRFVVRQSTRKPLTTLRLTGARRCSAKPRRLRADVDGAFRTRGRHSTATAHGTTWLQKDTCSTTTTVVARGTVEVRDFARKRSVEVRAGHRYTARG